MPSPRAAHQKVWQLQFDLIQKNLLSSKVSSHLEVWDAGKVFEILTEEFAGRSSLFQTWQLLESCSFVHSHSAPSTGTWEGPPMVSQ